MAKNYVQPGQVIDYTNGSGSSITSGTVIKMGNILGVAVADIADGEQGSVAIEGVFTGPKVSAAVFAVGEKLIWDVSANTGAGAFDDSSAIPATGDITGGAVAVVAGEDAQTTCTFKLTPGNTAVA